MPPIRLAYVVHDLADPAVARRLEMLRPFLADAIILGFHRAESPPARVAGWPAIALGRTADARMLQRATMVLRARLALGRLRAHFEGRDVILSRQLETLVLARAAQAEFAPEARLAQEYLDIHRLLVRRDLAGRALRMLERRLLSAVNLLVVSSPAFLDAHLRPAHGAALPPAELIENKVLAAEESEASSLSPPAAPPWRIGWYGMIRCRHSLEVLAGLVRRLPGLVEVEIRGRPALTAIPDFDAVVRSTPGLIFAGSYDRRRDLAAMYRGVHFTWAIDYFEAGANSDWLLPNRLYEGSLHGAIPIALDRVETGRWLAARNAGVLLEEPLEASLAAFFQGLTPATHAAAAARMAKLPRADLVDDGADGARLMAALTGAATPGQA